MRNGGWAMRAKDSCPATGSCHRSQTISRSGTQRFACGHRAHRAFAGIRTCDLFVADETLYQLSYNPDAPRLTARGERDHCNGNSPVTFASDMKRAPDASMLTGEVSSSLISGNPVLGFPSASCRSVMIRRPAAYKAAALPAELRQHCRIQSPPAGGFR